MEKPYIVFRRDSGVGLGFYYFAGTVESETAKRVTLSRGPARYIQPRQIVARFPSDQEAAFLARAISATRREYENRERRAREACAETIDELIERASK